MAWSDVVTRLITHDIGIAVAYIDRDTNKIIYNPPANTMSAIQALITISKENNPHSSDDVKALVSKK